MPEPRDYAADPSCSSRCLYLPCYLSITSTPSDWRKSTRSSRSFRLGRAFSTWERGPASRPWNSSAAVSTSPRLRSPTRTMPRSASSPSRITTAGPSRWPMPASTSCFSSNVLEHVPDLVAYACRNSPRAGARRQLSSRPSNPHVAALDHAGDLTSRRSRFPCPRCRSFFRKQRRAPPNCSDCGRPGTGPPVIRSASACPDGTVSAAMSSPSCGCFIPAGGGGISATTALPSSVTSPWGCSTPGKCCLGCALGLPSVSAWRACWAAPVTSSGLCRCRDRAVTFESLSRNSRAICCAGRPVVS